MEKGYRGYGHDMDNTDAPYEVGLGFTVKLDKPGGFIGREACQKARDSWPPRRRLVQVILKAPEPMLYHAEVVYRDGAPLGDIRSGSYGHTLGGALGLAMVEAEEPITRAFLESGSWEVDVAETRHPAVAASAPSMTRRWRGSSLRARDRPRRLGGIGSADADLRAPVRGANPRRPSS